MPPKASEPAAAEKTLEEAVAGEGLADSLVPDQTLEKDLDGPGSSEETAELKEVSEGKAENPAEKRTSVKEPGEERTLSRISEGKSENKESGRGSGSKTTDVTSGMQTADKAEAQSEAQGCWLLSRHASSCPHLFLQLSELSHHGQCTSAKLTGRKHRLWCEWLMWLFLCRPHKPKS